MLLCSGEYVFYAVTEMKLFDGGVNMKWESSKKFLALLLSLTMIFGLLCHVEPVSAATNPAKPKITVKASKDGASVTVTIKTTKNADGYLIEAKMPGAKKYEAVKTVELDGKKKRSVTVDTLISGKYSFRVKAYATAGSSTVWGKYSKAKTVTVKNSFDPETLGIKTGDIVTFGACDQDGKADNGKEPIDWIVLSNKNGKLFMVSVFVLEKGVIDDTGYEYMYDDEDDEDDDDVDTGKNTDNKASFDGTWKNSKLRTHLNGEFLNSAFSKKEIAFIADTELTDAACTDKVFLLSTKEVKNKAYGFLKDSEDMHRACLATPYVEAKGVEMGYYHTSDGRETCEWILRSPGENEYYLTYIIADGFIKVDYGGGVKDSDGYGIRPAMVISIK